MDESIVSMLETVQCEAGRAGRPFVTLSYAQSIDGSIATALRKPLPLSSPAALEITHALRAVHQAILIGIGTLLADDPALTVRFADGEHPQPIVVDSRLRTPTDSNLLDGPIPPWIAATDHATTASVETLEAAGAHILVFPPDPQGRVDLGKLLQALGERGVQRLMVEGGARIITSFLQEKLVDLLILTISPFLIGGTRAVSNLGGEGIHHFPRVENLRSARAGKDVILWGHPIWGAP
jgi:3,4-dihydroxy 2-butanone 4-phosphate synthase/GTP cyclohydrolase II